MSNNAKTDYLEELAGPDDGAATPHDRVHNLADVEKRHRILKLRRDGFTYDQIALALSRGDDGKPPIEISPNSISYHVRTYVADLHNEDAETVAEFRQIAHERLERTYRRLETDILQAPNTIEGRKIKERLIGQQLKVIERQAKLHGLDAPTRHEHSGSVNIFALANPEHVEKVDAEFRQRFGNGKAPLELPAAAVSEDE